MVDYSDRLQLAVAGRYRIERELGSGGMATVFLAQDLKHNRKVAIKVLQPELAAAMGPDRFLREIEISAKLQHPHILMLIDSGQVADSLYYVMPYVQGESLRERLDRAGVLPVDDAVRILRDVVDALAYAHRQGVVHRDMKPDNVLLSERHALVTDFGVATAVTVAAGRAELAATGLALGTPAYMAPEQAVAHEQIDHRADIYAVGALGYEILTGRPPFVGDSPQQVLAAQVRQQPEPVTSHRDSVPATLEQLIMRCLEKKPESRWQSAEEMLPQLEEFKTSPAATVLTGSRGRKSLIATLAAAFTLVAVAAVITFTGGGSSLDPRRVIVIPFENLSAESQYDPLGQVAASWIAEGLQQAGFVRVVPIQAVEAELESGGDRGVRELAEMLEAGTAVSGSYHVRGDSIHFASEIMDVSGTELVAATLTASALITEPMGAVEQLRRQVLGELAGHFDPWVTEFVDEARRPPLFSAFRSYLAGMDRFTQYDNERALPHFYRAWQLDSGFVTPAIAAAVAHWNLGEYGSADSLVRVVSRHRERVLPLDGYFLDFAANCLAGDYLAAHAAAREALLISSGGGWWEYQAGWTALAANRPRAALEHLERIDPEQASVRGWHFLWTEIGAAQHLLEDYRAELRTAMRGRALYPRRQSMLNIEVRARSALGRADEVASLLDDITAVTDDDNVDPWASLTLAALEFRAHGHEAAYEATIQRALNWLDVRPVAEGELRAHGFDRARALYWAERWEDAWVLFADLGSESPVPVARYGYLGVTHARLGNRAVAQRISSLLASIDRPYLFGETVAWRARIAAALGRTDEATELLSRALREGLRFSVELRHDFDLESLRGTPAFEELMRPSG
jgi:tetratricopeptide (TPR) repeat protein